MRCVPRVFLTMWRHSEEMFTSPPAPVLSGQVLSPIVNWGKVNGKFFNNLPKPALYPVLGCSPDPKFYKEHYWRSDNGPTMTTPAKHDDPYPFGKKYGFMTQFGVESYSSSVGDLSAPIQGYMFDHEMGCWVSETENPWTKDKLKGRDKENMMMKNKKMKMRKIPGRRLH